MVHMTLNNDILYQKAMLNRSYKAKIEYIERCKKENNWSGYIFMYERPHRLEVFAEISNLLTDREYWELLGEIWSDSENLWQYSKILPHLLNSVRPGREHMMSDEEKQFLVSLPEEFIIYRGHQKKNRLGYSWTLSYNKAAWFSTRFNESQHVASAIARKKDVIAVFLGRGELEIVINPVHLKVKNMKKSKSPFTDVWDEAKKAAILISIDHGVSHWEKVEQNAATLANFDKRIDEKVVRLFAILHDCQRKNENDDPEHGTRAATFAKTLFEKGKLPINEEQLEKLIYALRDHNDGHTSDDPTVGACWDADRLDLPRVGVIPDLKYFSTEAAKKLIWRI